MRRKRREKRKKRKKKEKIKKRWKKGNLGRNKKWDEVKKSGERRRW